MVIFRGTGLWRRGANDMMPASEMTSLVSAIAKRDGLAFERLYNGTSAKIYGVVLRILRRHDLAAAVLEDAYLAIWDNASKFDPALGSPISWMLAMARRRALDVARRPDTAASETE